MADDTVSLLLSSDGTVVWAPVGIVLEEGATETDSDVDTTTVGDRLAGTSLPLDGRIEVT